MRRTAALIALGLTLLTAAACGDNKTTTTPTAAAPTTAAASPDNEKACAAFQALFAQDRMVKFGTPVGQLIAARNAKNDSAAKAAEAKVKEEIDGLQADVAKIS